MVTDLITVQSLALEAFATDEEIAQWRTAVLAEERTKTQILDTTQYLEYTNYSYGEHVNGHRNYNNYRDSRGYDNWSKSNDRWQKSRDYRDTRYVAHSESYDRHSETYRDYRDHDRYSRYTRANIVDTGFNHQNYIPSTPQLYKIIGSCVNDKADFILASYDKNMDGFGSTDDASKTVYYTLKIRRVQDLNGNAISEPWKVLLDNSTTDRYKLDTSSYPEGIYEIYAIASNATRTEKGVTKEYHSQPIQNAFFTITDNNLPMLTVLNGSEFVNYGFGLDGKVSPSHVFTDYSLNMYVNAKAGQNAGLFIEVQLKDLDINQYHSAVAYLQSKEGSILTEKFAVEFEKDNDGISNKAGDKKGVVFIPYSEYLNDGIQENVKVVFEITDYADKNLTNRKGITLKTCPLTDDTLEYSLVNLDNVPPVVSISSANADWRIKETVNANVSETPDGKLGVMRTYYQVVPAGKSPTDAGWHTPNNDENLNIILNQNGVWDIYVKALDKAGNATVQSSKGFKISALDQQLILPRNGYVGFDANIQGTAECEKIDVTKGELWIDTLSSAAAASASKSGNKTTHTKAIRIPNTASEGAYVVFYRVTMANGQSQTISKILDVLDVVPVTLTEEPSVNHTSTWLQHLTKYNSQVDSSKKRDTSDFWAGENLCTKLKGFGIDHGTVEIVGDSASKANLVCSVNNPEMTDTVEWSYTFDGARYLEKYQDKKTSVTIRFKLYDMAGQETVKNVTISIDDIHKYHELHG